MSRWHPPNTTGAKPTRREDEDGLLQHQQPGWLQDCVFIVMQSADVWVVKLVRLLKHTVKTDVLVRVDPDLHVAYLSPRSATLKFESSIKHADAADETNETGQVWRLYSRLSKALTSRL